MGAEKTRLRSLLQSSSRPWCPPLCCLTLASIPCFGLQRGLSLDAYKVCRLPMQLELIIYYLIYIYVSTTRTFPFTWIFLDGPGINYSIFTYKLDANKVWSLLSVAINARAYYLKICMKLGHDQPLEKAWDCTCDLLLQWSWRSHKRFRRKRL
ncbi:hypothetical protein BDA96_05G016200 [Sorghum bicolor]|uniref:Uncharacterized protein n=1 Tax=Sorghum bicolor TaxID=4558 RepID=A0A921QXI9_SORBI|nr:hypothetical protein BDA96_05G016200 [Sorghum bicolor]